MLEYFKIVLAKVSFDKGLFEKELWKAIKNLMLNEINELKKWCYKKFGKKHQEIIERCFTKFDQQINLTA